MCLTLRKGEGSQHDKKALLAGALLLLSASVYFYLPLRAAQNPTLNWGDPRTLEKLIWHVTGKQYQVNLFSSPLDHILGQAAYFGQLWLRQFTLMGALLAFLAAFTNLTVSLLPPLPR